MDSRLDIATLFSDIDALTPGGFAIGLHIGLRGPAFLFQTFPQSWLDVYIGEGLQLQDPAVAWSLSNTGHAYWRDLAENDPANVMGRAAEHGMPYGTTIAIVGGQSRSVLGCARQDRDYLLAELDAITQALRGLHDLTLGKTTLDAEIVATLKRMSIRLSHG